MKRIPIAAAKRIAKEYDYDQVIIMARVVEEEEVFDHLTTYGRNREHCYMAEQWGKYFAKQMGWQDGSEE